MVNATLAEDTEVRDQNLEEPRSTAHLYLALHAVAIPNRAFDQAEILPDLLKVWLGTTGFWSAKRRSRAGPTYLPDKAGTDFVKV